MKRTSGRSSDEARPGHAVPVNIDLYLADRRC